VKLRKEILRPGRFIDRSGLELVVTPEDIQSYAAGTAQLQAMGHEVVAYPSHVSESSEDVLGVWGVPVVEVVDGEPRLFAELTPEPDLKPSEVERIKRRQVSCVTWENYPTEAGSIPRAITRIDIVPSGAVMGLAPFTVALAAIGNVTFHGPNKGKTRCFTLSGQAPALEETMKLSEMLPGVKAAFESCSEDERKTFMSALGAPAEADPEAAKKAEEEKKKAEASSAALASQVAAQRAEIDALKASDAEHRKEREKRERAELDARFEAKLSSLIDPIPEDRLKAIRGDYEALRAPLGHERALSMCMARLDDVSEGARRRALSGVTVTRTELSSKAKPAQAAGTPNPVEVALSNMGHKPSAN